MSEKIRAAAIPQHKLADLTVRKMRPPCSTENPSSGLTADPSNEPSGGPTNHAVFVKPKNQVAPSVPLSNASTAKASRSPPEDTGYDGVAGVTHVCKKIKLPRSSKNPPSGMTSDPSIEANGGPTNHAVLVEPKNRLAPLVPVSDASTAKASSSSPKDTGYDGVAGVTRVCKKIKLPRTNVGQPARKFPAAPTEMYNVVPGDRAVSSGSVAASAPMLPSSASAAEPSEASRIDPASTAPDRPAPGCSTTQGAQQAGNEGDAAGSAEPAEEATPSSSRYKRRVNLTPEGVVQLTPSSQRRKLAFRESIGDGMLRIATIGRFVKDGHESDVADDDQWFHKKRMALTQARRPSPLKSRRLGFSPGGASRGGWVVPRCALMQEAGLAGSERALQDGLEQAGEGSLTQAGGASSKQAKTADQGEASSKQGKTAERAEASSKKAGAAEGDGSKTVADDPGEQVHRTDMDADQGCANSSGSKEGENLDRGAEGPVVLTKELLLSRMRTIFAQETCDADEKPSRIARQVKACLKRCYLSSMLDIRAFEASTSEGSEDGEEENAGEGEEEVSGEQPGLFMDEQVGGGFAIHEWRSSPMEESLAAVEFRKQCLREIKKGLEKEMEEIEALEREAEMEEKKGVQQESSEEDDADEADGDAGEKDAEVDESYIAVVDEKVQCMRSLTRTVLSMCEKATSVDQQLAQRHPSAAAAAMAAGSVSAGTVELGDAATGSGSAAAVIAGGTDGVDVTAEAAAAAAAGRSGGVLVGKGLVVLTPRTAARGLADLGHPDMPGELD